MSIIKPHRLIYDHESGDMKYRGERPTEPKSLGKIEVAHLPTDPRTVAEDAADKGERAAAKAKDKIDDTTTAEALGKGSGSMLYRGRKPEPGSLGEITTGPLPTDPTRSDTPAEPQPETAEAPVTHGWDPATGRFKLSAKEFQRDTLGQHFSELAIKVNGRIAAKKVDSSRDGRRTGEYYYVRKTGDSYVMTKDRALLSQKTVVTKDIPDNVLVQLALDPEKVKQQKAAAKAAPQGKPEQAPEATAETFNQFKERVVAKLEAEIANERKIGTTKADLARYKLKQVYQIISDNSSEGEKRAEITKIVSADHLREVDFAAYRGEVLATLKTLAENTGLSAAQRQLAVYKYNWISVHGHDVIALEYCLALKQIPPDQKDEYVGRQ